MLQFSPVSLAQSRTLLDILMSRDESGMATPVDPPVSSKCPRLSEPEPELNPSPPLDSPAPNNIRQAVVHDAGKDVVYYSGKRRRWHTTPPVCHCWQDNTRYPQEKFAHLWDPARCDPESPWAPDKGRGSTVCIIS